MTFGDIANIFQNLSVGMDNGFCLFSLFLILVPLLVKLIHLLSALVHASQAGLHGK